MVTERLNFLPMTPKELIGEVLHLIDNNQCSHSYHSLFYPPPLEGPNVFQIISCYKYSFCKFESSNINNLV